MRFREYITEGKRDKKWMLTLLKDIVDVDLEFDDVNKTAQEQLKFMEEDGWINIKGNKITVTPKGKKELK